MFSTIAAFCATFCGKLVAAVLALVIGRAIIKFVLKKLDASEKFNKDPSVKSFAMNGVKIGLYVLLIIAVIGILGIPTASIVAVIASAGVAIGLALQGSLANLAGGVMLMIFRPIHVGDYVTVAGVTGTIRDINLFYTIFVTPDNKRITVPNGSLMNNVVTDYTQEKLRRADLKFVCSNEEAPEKVTALLLDTVKANGKVLAEPAPAARFTGAAGDTMEYAVQAWCRSADVSAVHYELTLALNNAMKAGEIKGSTVPATPDI